MPELTYTRPWVYPKQAEAIFNSKRYSLIEASTKSGKTTGCLIWIAERTLECQRGHNTWWVAPSIAQANMAFKRLCEATTPGVFTSNKTDRTVTFANGATCWFKTGEEPDKLYGEDVYACVIDEASRVREEAWVAIRSTITATGAPVRIIGNVKGRKNWFYEMARRAEREAGDPTSNLHYSKLTVLDAVEAGVFDENEAEDARLGMSEAAFKQLYYAEAADDGGNPFGGPEAIAKCEIPEVRWEHNPVAWGWDIAKSQDYTVGIGLDAEGKICRFYRERRKPWSVIIADIKRLTGNTPALVDATRGSVGDPVVEILQRESGQRNYEAFEFTSQSKQQLMEGLAVAIQREEIFFQHNPVGLELAEFEYEFTRTGVIYSAPRHKESHDDCVCALALAWKLYRRAPKPVWVQDLLNWRPPALVSIFAR